MENFKVYQGKDGKLNIRVVIENGECWLTQKQMAEVFGTARENITMHLKSIFDSEELDENSVCKKSLLPAADGKSYQTKMYNLDAIISVGYRVNSKEGVAFRRWSNSVLREHIVNGITLKADRLRELGIAEAQQALKLATAALTNSVEPLVTDKGREVLDLINRYAQTWTSLKQYDDGTLALPDNLSPARKELNYHDARRAVDQFKSYLGKSGEDSPGVGQEREDAFKAIIGNIEQTMFGEALYKTREEKAANLLYFLVKDHPFGDGNKRTGALLFTHYMEREGIKVNLGADGLTALTLLVAQSDPGQKDMMVRLITNMLVERGQEMKPQAKPKRKREASMELGL